MYIEDLKTFPEGSSPSFYGDLCFTVDGQPVTDFLAHDCHLVAVAWLGDQVERSGTESPSAFIERLFDHHTDAYIFNDSTCGWHTCEICLKANNNDHKKVTFPDVSWQGRELQVVGRGHHLVRYNNKVYICPELILHYLLDHQYQPPVEFVEAVINGSFLTEADLEHQYE